MAVLVTLSVATGAACGGGDGKGRGGAGAPSTTTRATAAVATGFPLTGLPLGDPRPAPHAALVVKIDNAPKARPQVGINEADVVVEEQVEGGVTRFASIFHSTDVGRVGPVRSARSTDIAIVSPLHRPLFAYSGTNATFLRLVRAAPLVDVGHDAASGAYRRDRSRPAPYNLFASPAELRAHAPAGEDPPALFAYRRASDPFGAAGAKKVAGIHYEFRDIVTTIVDFTWDGAARGWRRTQHGTPHVDAAGAQVAPANVVVQFTRYADTGQRDRSGAAVPEAELLGEGDAWILSGGRLALGRWRKGAADEVTSYVDSEGAAVLLAPGHTWVVLLPPGQAREVPF